MKHRLPARTTNATDHLSTEPARMVPSLAPTDPTTRTVRRVWTMTNWEAAGAERHQSTLPQSATEARQRSPCRESLGPRLGTYCQSSESRSR